MEGILKAAVAYSKILFWHMPANTNERYETPVRTASLNVKNLSKLSAWMSNLLGLLACMSKPFKIVSLNVKTSWDWQPECQNLLGLSAWMSKPCGIVSLKPKPFRTVGTNVKTYCNWQHEYQNLLGLLTWMLKPVWIANLNVKTFQDCQPEC